jgi:mono/diheme cytochrome c family protein
MAEVVQHSTSKLNDADVHAIAVYLADVTGGSDNETKAADANQMRAGAAIFNDTCSACHQSSGEGVPHMFPPLKGNANVQSRDPTSTIRVIVEGARTVPTDARPTPSAMPSFGWKLSNDQVAAVATYVRNSWGNAAPPVGADDVGKLKKDLASTAHAPPGEAR